MRKVFYIAIPLVIIVVVSGFFTSENSQKSTSCNLTVTEFVKIEKSDGVILDVRTKGEFDGGHVSEAILIDVNANTFEEKINQLDKNKKYYVYCKSGIRSSRAVDIMNEEGFTNICNIEGGVRAFAAAGVPLVK